MWFTNQFLYEMERINFRKILIENLKTSLSSCRESPRQSKENIDDLVFKIKNIDQEKGVIAHDFIQSLISLHQNVRKEIIVINKEFQNIMKAYKEEDCDTVDGIVDDLKQAENKMISFAKKAAANEQFKRI